MRVIRVGSVIQSPPLYLSCTVRHSTVPVMKMSKSARPFRHPDETIAHTTRRNTREVPDPDLQQPEVDGGLGQLLGRAAGDRPGRISGHLRRSGRVRRIDLVVGARRPLAVETRAHRGRSLDTDRRAFCRGEGAPGRVLLRRVPEHGPGTRMGDAVFGSFPRIGRGQAHHGPGRRRHLTITPDIEDLLRSLSPQVLGALIRRYGDFDLCEDAVQEALLAATLQWPVEGLPANPRGWLA